MINIFVCLVKSLSLLQKIKTLSVTTLLVTKATTHLILKNGKTNFKKLKASSASQQNSFHRAKNISENATFASYEVAHLIAKHGKPFSDGEFVKSV